jgi:hypothetical protein
LTGLYRRRPSKVFAFPPKRPVSCTRDRWFESVSLQQRVGEFESDVPRTRQRTETDDASQKIGRSPRRGCVVSCGRGQGTAGYSMVEDRFFKRLRKKARKGLRGWPIATVAFYGPNLSQATKVAVGIVPSENAEVEELRDWKVDRGDIRSDPDIAREMLEFIQQHQVKSVAITDGIIGCPHQEGIDYDGEWCPVCEFWHGRDRFTGQRVH